MNDFLRAYAGQFEPEVQDKGEAYANGGAVTIVEGASDGVRAVVQGTRRYDVRFLADPAGFVASCSCPYYAGGTNCKHLWAVARVATTEGYLGDLARWLDEDADDAPAPPSMKPRETTWRDLLQGVRDATPSEAPRKRRLLYVADIAEILRTGLFLIRLRGQRLRKDGTWTDPEPRGMRPEDVDAWPDKADRAILERLFGAPNGLYFAGHERRERFELRGSLLDDLLPRLCATGRFLVRRAEGTETPVTWSGRARWRAKLRLEHSEERWRLRGELRRGRARIALSAPELLLSSGHFFADGQLARFSFDGAFEWIRTLRRAPDVPVSDREIDDFLEQIYELPGSLPFEIPRKLRAKTVKGAPGPKLEIESGGGRGSLLVTLSFRYGGAEIAAGEPRDRIFERGARRVILRDREAEAQARERMAALGFRPVSAEEEDVDFALAPALLPRVVKELSAAGWAIVADGSAFRAPSEFRMSVASGTDWFDLDAGVKYGDEWVPLPKLLAAAKAGTGVISLGDGSTGMLPEDWLRKRGLLLAAGELEGGALRFRKSQAVLLDVLLAEEKGTAVDATFRALSQGLGRFDGVRAKEPPKNFIGALRPYQKLGLGWMDFLRKTGLGGCLADDMGLGKTVTVLALLAGRKGPSLAVVPRSLIFNWKAEAARFVPGLRVMDYTGSERRGDFQKADLILTTYGTLRRDAALLKDVEFDYVILDEAQAIKNEGSQTAKAARLLKGKQRLALSGTPIENHLGELWSLAEFLNPGLLGRSSVFSAADEEGHALLAKVVRPWILRRTKAQVVPELPAKTEQTIHVELDETERARYDELRDYYRRALLTDPKEWNRTKFNVLEGLLRLRQAACHPGLIDPARKGESSAKLDELLDRLREIADEGHKALVFSQFTSFLDIVRGKMAAENLTYEYLDGQTRDREARVKRFQEDPACPFFLISLKAGGLGLNLTAAEYVFLLDPWWNPAVEAQAVDRAHRLGQSRKVFAYRLVARGTVEEKVLELQAAKRELADAILREDAGFLKRMTREDLEVLLS